MQLTLDKSNIIGLKLVVLKSTSQSLNLNCKKYDLLKLTDNGIFINYVLDFEWNTYEDIEYNLKQAENVNLPFILGVRQTNNENYTLLFRDGKYSITSNNNVRQSCIIFRLTPKEKLLDGILRIT